MSDHFKLTSPAFGEDGLIPEKYTCDGADVSPPLSWQGAPPGTQCYALICDDPDAPSGTWVHWVIYDIPVSESGLEEKQPAVAKLENHAIQGTSSFYRLGYSGPCPPSGTHRYFFKLYALDARLNLKPGVMKDDLLEAMDGHILARAELIGRYRKH